MRISASLPLRGSLITGTANEEMDLTAIFQITIDMCVCVYTCIYNNMNLCQ